MSLPKKTGRARNDERVILHFDYDCFYASVFEAENPALHGLPLAVQQKHIIVTCNYEARRRGLRKLQLITEARQMCPDVVIVLGEDLTRFRNASKMLYDYLRSFAWSKRAERLGFDEVFLDVTDMVEYNVELLNHGDLPNSFFHLSREDPTAGFSYDASIINRHTWPTGTEPPVVLPRETALDVAATARGIAVFMRLLVGSHLAQHLRLKLEEEKRFTSTVGISTSKLLAKLAGNVNKPKSQTTLLPRFDRGSHEIGKIPGIGFKIANKIRNHVLGRPAENGNDYVHGAKKEKVTVTDVLDAYGMGPELLAKLFAGPGFPQDIGTRVWELLNAVDDTEVRLARSVPRQISIEDSYLRLDTLDQVRTELVKLSTSLIRRMRTDLLEEDAEFDEVTEVNKAIDPGRASNSPGADAKTTTQRWIAHPRTLRLSTRPRPPPNSDGSRSRSHNRISRSGPMPSFVFSLALSPNAVAEKLVNEALLPHFRKLHPERRGWDLSLVNIGATNMVAVANDGTETIAGAARDIGRMFKRQDTMLKAWKVEDRDVPPDDFVGGLGKEHVGASREPILLEPHEATDSGMNGSEELMVPTQDSRTEGEESWRDEDDAASSGETCVVCGAVMPSFAMTAHQRYHDMGD